MPQTTSHHQEPPSICRRALWPVLLGLGAAGLCLALILWLQRSSAPTSPTAAPASPAAQPAAAPTEAAAAPTEPVAEPAVTGEAAPPAATEVPMVAETRPPLEADWGIRVVGLRLTAGGTLLDLRYTVLDPEKAAKIAVQESRSTYLIDEASGTQLPLTTATRGGARQRSAAQLTSGRAYSLVFPNPGRKFQAGTKVTVVMGDFKAEGLTVE